MRGLEVAQGAEQDLAETWHYIARDSPRAATTLIRQLRATFAMLRQRPFLGEVRHDLRPDLRAFCKKKYVIYYRFDDRVVTIMRVLHGARDATAIFAEDEG